MKKTVLALTLLTTLSVFAADTTSSKEGITQEIQNTSCEDLPDNLNELAEHTDKIHEMDDKELELSAFMIHSALNRAADCLRKEK